MTPQVAATDASATAPAAADALDALDASRLAAYAEVHRQIQDHLDRMLSLAALVQAGGPDAAIQAEAGAIEAFFSGTARRHHADEERVLFPALLAGGDEERATTVSMLQQDHGWIDQNWGELGPLLSALAQGHHWVEPEELRHDVEVFRDLCTGHLALEDTLIPPPTRAS